MNTSELNKLTPCRIIIFGAGSVGCYVGARLLSAGANVTFVGRPRMRETLQQHPLLATDYQGFKFETRLQPNQYQTDAACAANADLVLVTVKSAATETAGLQLAEFIRPGTAVISLQNGISNSARLEKAIPHAQILAGMIAFNVLHQHPGHFHHGTEGHLMATRHPSLNSALPWFTKAGLPLQLRDDMVSVMWSKLLLNLNNPVNALSGVPLLEQLSQRNYRRCLAMAQDETLALLKAARIPIVKLTGLPMPLIPTIMRLPDWIFARLAKTMLAIDPVARSSMWEDLEAGRATEIDWINGEVIKLAHALGRDAPVNQHLTRLIHDCEQQRRNWTADELLSELS